MLFSSFFTIAVATSAFAAPSAQTLKPWKIDYLFTTSPSGRQSPALSEIRFSINDTNTIRTGTNGRVTYPPSSADCAFRWPKGAQPVYDTPTPCINSRSHSQWSFTLIKGTSPYSNFSIEVELTNEVTVSGKKYVKKFQGGDHFEQDKNLKKTCSASGICSWALKKTPELIQQKEIK